MKIRDFVLDVYENLRSYIEAGELLDAFVNGADAQFMEVRATSYFMRKGQICKERHIFIYEFEQVFEFVEECGTVNKIGD